MISRSQAETEQIARSLAAQLRPGDVLLLSGDLGAGKTAFARGIARGLGITEPVASPTFTILSQYAGRIALHHFDLYRLEGSDAFYEAGLEDYVGGDAVSVIEWPEQAWDALPARHLRVRIAYGDVPDTRDITITPQGGFREVAWP